MAHEQTLSRLKVCLSSLREKEKLFKSPEAVSGTIEAGIQAILDGKISFEGDHTGLVAEGIKAEAKFEKAVEGYLGEVLPALCVRTVERAIEGMKLLKEEKAGSGKFMFFTEQKNTEKEVEIPPEICGHESFMGKLSDKVRFENGIEKNLKPLLDQCIVVQDIDAARMYYHWHPDLDYVTPEGDVIRSKEGLVRHVREGSREGSLLTLKNKLESIKKEIEKTEADISVQSQKIQELKKELSIKGKKQEEVMEQMRRLEKEMLSLEHEEKRHLEKLAYAEKKGQILQEELTILDEERKSVLNHCEEAKSAAAAAEEAFSGKEEKINHLKEESGSWKEQIAEKSKAMSSIYEQYAVPSGKAASLQTDVMHLKENLKDLKNRVEDTRREESSGQKRIYELRNSKKMSTEAVEGMIQQRTQSQVQLEKLKKEIASRKGSLSTQELEIKQIRMKLDEIRLTLGEREVERTKIQGDIKHNAEACQEELSKEIDEIAEPVAISEEINEQELAQEILDLKENIQRIGPINMMAIEEYNKLEERYQFLSKQRKDLTDSIESLTETIRKINRTSREKFQEAFQGTNEGFDEIFKILFNGGHAELRLEDEKDILESGIEIIAQPPGKKLQNMNLLSGGEKALTVIALLFAVFRFQPSPFCLLDEVDSALDDVNIGKFINMLRSFSDKTQFILITHNKKTMEVANLLYGVTMEEPGISKIVSLKLN
jgi:chromosome segregation protein